MEGKSKTALIVGGSIAAVVLIIIVVVAVKPSNTPQYPYGMNPALYPPGYVPNQSQSDKAALYTGIASVANNTLDTFFGHKETTQKT